MVSLLSTLEIQGNETLVDFYQHKESKKYGFIIMHNKEKYCRPIISSDAIYNSKKVAKEEGSEVMQQIKDFDLDAHRKSLVNTIGTETAKVVASVVKASKSIDNKVE